MNEEKMTLKESVRLTLRAWCFYWKNTPRFVLSTVLWALADARQPLCRGLVLGPAGG